MHPCAMTAGIVTVSSLVTRVGSGPGVTMTSVLRHQFGRDRGEAILFSLCVSILNDNVFPLHITQLTQTLAECLDAG